MLLLKVVKVKKCGRLVCGEGALLGTLSNVSQVPLRIQLKDGPDVNILQKAVRRRPVNDRKPYRFSYFQPNYRLGFLLCR
jgi:hypothetical protein